MDIINDIKKFYNELKSHDDDDFVDKLSRKVTFVVFLVVASLTTVYNYTGEPFKCWCLSEHDCDYAHSFCYISKLYIPNINKTLQHKDEVMQHVISYYPWLNYMISVMAAIIIFPHVVWMILYKMSGYQTQKYVRKLLKDQTYITKCNETAKAVAANIYEVMKNKKKPSQQNFLFASFIFVKICYLVALFILIVLVNYWISDLYYSDSNQLSIFQKAFGLHNFNSLYNRFPRITLCRFNVYKMLELQPQWLQCTLPPIIYFEKFFLVIWFWLCLLFVMSILSIFYYFYIIFKSGRDFISNRLIDDLNSNFNKDRFLSFLQNDTILLLKLIYFNTDDFYVTEIINELNDKYKIDKIYGNNNGENKRFSHEDGKMESIEESERESSSTNENDSIENDENRAFLNSSQNTNNESKPLVLKKKNDSPKIRNRIKPKYEKVENNNKSDVQSEEEDKL